MALMRQEQFGGAKNEEEEKLFAVKEYLHLEIKLAVYWFIGGTYPCHYART